MSAGRPARLAVGVVSAGRVGAVVGAALAAAGHRVVAASGVSRASVNRAEALLPGVPLVPPDEAAAGADLVLLAVPDDVLPGLVRGLAAAGCFRPGQIVVHTSGAQGVAVLDPATAHGVLPLALHPVMTFTGRTEDVARLAGCQRRRHGDGRGGGRLERRRGARRRDGRGAGPRARDRPSALPRRARARRQPPGHARARLRRTSWSRPASIPPSGSSRRCCRPRWTTRCGTATARSPDRSPAATPAPSAPTCASSTPSTPTWPGPTASWPPAPPAGRRAQVCCPPTPRTRCAPPSRRTQRSDDRAHPRAATRRASSPSTASPAAISPVTRALRTRRPARSRWSRRWARCTRATAS